jgi:AbrB family looped-hinge helix DNA binding protein
MSTATLSSKFQISVPKDVREALGLKPGQKLAFINTGTGMRLVPQPAILDLVGIARGANTDGVRDREDRLARLPAAKVRRKPNKT